MTQTKKNDRETEILNTLSDCTGTENYYRWKLGPIEYLLTDGVKTMCDMCGANWLVDVVISHQMKAALRREPFQTWELKPSKSSCGAMVKATDGNGNKLASQRIASTDFPLKDGIKLYLQDKVLMLPSEY